MLLLAIILLSTKVLGLVTERIQLPQVLGALLAGIILGPTGFGVLQSTDFLVKTAEIGVIMLMFTAGIDTDMKELKATGVQAFVVALLGVIFPIILCGGIYLIFFPEQSSATAILKASFMGAVFAATSVSITVETLNEMGKLKTKTGTVLLSAALIDDILGIIVLSFLSGFSTGESNPLEVMGHIVLFFIFVLVVGLVVRRLFGYIAEEHWHSRRVAVWALAFCLLMSYVAEVWFGVADITVTAYMVFTPVFFANIGMMTNMRNMNSEILIFALLLIVAAVISKILGCGLGARLCGMSNPQSLVVGIGMVARSEVALMVAQKGLDSGLIPEQALPAIVLSIVASALVTPILLKIAVGKSPAAEL